MHCKTFLKINGKFAIVVRDNVLFEGCAGETARRKLLHECDVHTLLRLPIGMSYACGVKENVLFFDGKLATEKPCTERLWMYDLRTNKHFILKVSLLLFEGLQDFIKYYNHENRQKKAKGLKLFTYDELMQRDKVNFDIFWLKDENLEDS